MRLIGGSLGYHILRKIGPSGESAGDGAAYRDRSKLEVMLGADVWTRIPGRSVIDFGCGVGEEAMELARRGAAHVTGIDIWEPVLREARPLAEPSRPFPSGGCALCTTVSRASSLTAIVRCRLVHR